MQGSKQFRKNFSASKVIRLTPIAAGCASMLLIAGMAQAQNDPLPSGEPTTVVISGIRQSMQSSLNLKRNSNGIVDGIVAEDIGKFPDTNLAESLQRISGVSIDRSIGEGSRVTVRGIGPDFNMVLLNGRQMPTSNLGDRNGRGFDFANIASEGISQIQVYKSSRADTPTGGIGATLNVMTLRPFDNPGFHSGVGVKGVKDMSADNLPNDVKRGQAITPEFSGFYSDTSADGKFGIALSASRQDRNLGYNRAEVANGWRGPFRADENNWGTLPQPGTPNADLITNRPKGNEIYSVPQNLNYTFSGVQRQRTNGQLTLQFKPVDELITTLDYTLSQNKIQTRAADVGVWMNFGKSSSSWNGGSPNSPSVYTELFDSNSPQDIAMAAALFATKTVNKSLGFNTVWKPTKNLKLELDAHKSSAESMADSPYGSMNRMANSAFTRYNTSIDFSNDFPVVNIQGVDYTKGPPQLTGSTFQNGYVKNDVDQLQLKGALKLPELESKLNFGVSATTSKNRTAFSNMQIDTWGGATKPSDYPSSLYHPESISKYFKQISGSNTPGMFNNFFTYNFEEMNALAQKVTGNPKGYLANPNFDTDSRVEEKTKSVYLQLSTDFDTVLPMHTSIGLRYEKTDVFSTALVPTATGITWVSQNELPITFGAPAFTSLKGQYNTFLPSLDYQVDLTPELQMKASYGENIGRPRYDQIQGGQVLDRLANAAGGTGSQGNPGLKPVKSKNLDLSLEWYYSKQSFMSMGLFKKDLSNYAGQSQIMAQPFNLRTPVGGKYWNAALAAGGCVGADTTCIRNYIFRNFAGQPGVVRGPDNGTGQATGVITALPDDPLANFRISSYANQQDASLRGLEFNVQHMFGESGFGIASNFTWVKSGLSYDNNKIGEQFALLGMSNSANLVGIYEKGDWSGRAAYNWRGEFLNSVFDGAGPNPQYTEAYGQLDLNIGYAYNKQLSFQFEVINLLNATTRVHGRTKSEVLGVFQGGPRFMIGARYKF
nr:TonB-dependent receptor [uncultured Undibacterium sp.]